MYEAIPDPYCYPGTTVLINKLGTRDPAELQAFETTMSALRGEEPSPRGQLGYAHYRAIHRHLFQDVYRWAGRIRTVRISKGDSMFCYPENIDAQMGKLFSSLKDASHLHGLDPAAFAHSAARFLSDLNAIHPFREGNGRTQLAYLVLLAEAAGHRLDLERLDAAAMFTAMVESFKGDEGPLFLLIRGMALG
jgi:cell filamentation protein